MVILWNNVFKEKYVRLYIYIYISLCVNWIYIYVCVCVCERERERERERAEYIYVCVWERERAEYIYIYIYIYSCVCVCARVCVVIHRRTVSLYHLTSVGLDTRDTSRWDQNMPDFTSAGYLTPVIVNHCVSAETF